MKNRKLLFVLVLSLIGQAVFAGSAADSLVINKTTSNCNLINVDCYYQSNKDIDQYCWDFGDGSTMYCSTNDNSASHEYNKVGTYTITLYATSGANTDTIVKKNVVTIHNAPVAKFKIENSDAIRYAPYQASFTNQSTKGDGDTLKYSWSIYDTAFSTDTNATYTFTTPKTYLLGLTVTDNYGCKSDARDDIVIKDSVQKGEFDYITSSCHGYYGNIINSYSIINDTLIVSGSISANCGADKTATAKISNDTVYIRTFESGLLTTCDCDFDFLIKLGGINKDSIPVYFNNELYTAKRYVNSITEIKSSNKIKVFPNPASNYFIIENPDFIQNHYRIKIYNLQGQEVYQNNNINTESVAIKSKTFSPGEYLIKSFDDKNHVFVNKIIINQ